MKEREADTCWWLRNKGGFPLSAKGWGLFKSLGESLERERGWKDGGEVGGAGR